MAKKENKLGGLSNTPVLKENTAGGRRMRPPMTKGSPNQPPSNKPRSSGKTDK